jgi:hypothetical protein
VLAAVGGVGCFQLVPEKWAKPEMEMGVLPAHAQSTVDCLLVGDVSIMAITTTLMNGEFADFDLYIVTPDNSIVSYGEPGPHQGAEHHGDNHASIPRADHETITITNPVSGTYYVRIFFVYAILSPLYVTVVIQTRNCVHTFQMVGPEWCVASLSFPGGTVIPCSVQNDTGG